MPGAPTPSPVDPRRVVTGRSRAPRLLRLGLRRAWLRAAAASLVASGGVVIGLSVSAYGASDAPHVMVVMMENRNLTDVVGQSDWPYTNSLIAQAGLATQSYSMQTGSLPNYIALVTGSTQGVSPDDTPAEESFPGVPTVADQLVAAGYTAKAYAEDLPADPTQDSGDYVARHNPWAYLPDAQITVADSSSLVTDLDSAQAPDFVWFTPNDVDDGDSGSSAAADSFLSTFVPEVQSTSWYADGGQIVIEWDESSDETTGIGGTVGGGNIPTIVVSAALAAHPEQEATPVDTVGVLRSIEDVYGLPYLGGSAADGTIDSLLSTNPDTTTTAPPTTAPPATTAPTTVSTPTSTTAVTPTTSATSVTTASATSASTTPGVTVAPGAGSAVPGTTEGTTRSGAAAAPASARSGGGSGGSGGSPGASTDGAVSAPSGALALTGTGDGVSSVAIVGGGLVLVGLVLFGLMSGPRRRLGLVGALAAPGGWTGGGPAPRRRPGPALPTSIPRRSDLWLVPPA